MAPRKKPAAKAANRKPVKRPTKAEMKKIAQSLAPKKRTAYAIFVKENRPRIRDEMFPEAGKTNQKQNRQLFSAVGKAWGDLSKAAKDVYMQRSKQEVEARRKAIKDMVDIVPETKQQCAEPVGRIGDYELVSHGHERLPGHSADCYLVQHRVMRTRARAVFYNCQDEFQREIACLKCLYKAFEEESEDVDFKENEELFHRLLYATMDREQEPNRCIVTDFFPPLGSIGVDSDKWLLRDVAYQMARSVSTLHRLSLLHLDLRPQAWYYDGNARCVKLANFRLCRQEDDTTDITCPPYLLPYRAPELHAPLSEIRTRLGQQGEAWAFGVSLVELASGRCMFSTLQDIFAFRKAKNAARGNEAMRVLHAGVQKTLLHFLCQDGARLSVVEFAQDPAFAQSFVNLSVLND
ncbi:mpkC [Symbiodinium sp. CCMP2592]|nr:mpkC [Symbiodinium sp. CCMP2592]